MGDFSLGQLTLSSSLTKDVYYRLNAHDMTYDLIMYFFFF